MAIARAFTSVRFPVAFLLVAAMNPCPCGCFIHPRKPCKCSGPQIIDRYLARISGPLLEWIDFHVEMPAVPISSQRDIKVGTNSASMRTQVERALQRNSCRPATARLYRTAPSKKARRPPSTRCFGRDVRRYLCLLIAPTMRHFPTALDRPSIHNRTATLGGRSRR